MTTAEGIPPAYTERPLRPSEWCCGRSQEERQKRAEMFTMSPWVFMSVGFVALAAYIAYYIVGLAIPASMCSPYMLWVRQCPEEKGLSVDGVSLEFSGLVETLECVDDENEYCITKPTKHGSVPLQTSDVPEGYMIQGTVRKTATGTESITDLARRKKLHEAMAARIHCVYACRAFTVPIHPTAIVAAHQIAGPPIANPAFPMCGGNPGTCSPVIPGPPINVPAAPVANVATKCNNNTQPAWTSGAATECVVLGGSTLGVNRCRGTVGTITDGETASGAPFLPNVADWFHWDDYEGFTWILREAACTGHDSDESPGVRKIQDKLRPAYVGKREVTWIDLAAGDYSWFRGDPSTHSITAMITFALNDSTVVNFPLGQRLLGEFLTG